MNTRSTLALVAVVALLGGCGGDSTGPDDTGKPLTQSSFTATVSGGSTASLKGLAAFGTGTDPDTGEQVFALALTDSTHGLIGFARQQSGVPAVGTYTLVDVTSDGDIPASDFAAAAELFQGGSLSAAYGSTSGTLTISSSSAKEIKGSFSINASGASLTTGQAADATITGTFDAVGATGKITFPSADRAAVARLRRLP